MILRNQTQIYLYLFLNDFKKSNYHSSRNDLIEWGFLHEEKDEDELEVIKKQIKEVLKK